MFRHRVDNSVVYRDLEDLPETRQIEAVDVEQVAVKDPPIETVDREPYLPDPQLVENVNLAIALGRPLLLQGDPGCGKTRLAYAVAYSLGLPLETCYIKSTSKAQDLLYTYDAVRRLYDAQLGTDAPKDASGEPLVRDIRNYIRLGPLGRAIVRAQFGRRSVVLINEIDKADLDFPNDLLWELDRLEFTVAEAPGMHYKIGDHPELRPIVIVTDNEEKPLGAPFLRRCIFHYLEFPESKEHLQQILALHHPENEELNQRAIPVIRRLRGMDLKKKPGLSELLDWVGYLETTQTSNEQVEKLPFIGALLKEQTDQQPRERKSAAVGRSQRAEDSLWELFQQLRRRRLALGISDYDALWQALRAGYGWQSREALRELCCALWAKSREERDVLFALFDQLLLPAWDLDEETYPATGSELPTENQGTHFLRESVPKTQASRGIPPIPEAMLNLPEREFVLAPLYPLNYREIAQIWRRLRRPFRVGSAIELNITATIERRCRVGVASPPVLTPRARNALRMLMLVDRNGSMAPFHQFVEQVCGAIQQGGRFREPMSTISTTRPLKEPMKGC